MWFATWSAPAMFLAALDLAESLGVREHRAGIDALDRAWESSVADRPAIDVATPVVRWSPSRAARAGIGRHDRQHPLRRRQGAHAGRVGRQVFDKVIEKAPLEYPTQMTSPQPLCGWRARPHEVLVDELINAPDPLIDVALESPSPNAHRKQVPVLGAGTAPSRLGKDARSFSSKRK